MQDRYCATPWRGAACWTKHTQGDGQAMHCFYGLGGNATSHLRERALSDVLGRGSLAPRVSDVAGAPTAARAAAELV